MTLIDAFFFVSAFVLLLYGGDWLLGKWTDAAQAEIDRERHGEHRRLPRDWR